MNLLGRLDIGVLAWDFHDIDSIATPLFEAASQKLEELESRHDEELRARRAKANTEDEDDLASQAGQWQEELHLRRKQALGAIALHLLQLSVRKRLDMAKKHFDKSHPATHTYTNNREGWPNRFKKEYKDRFGIDFDRCPVPFSRIEELVLARNAAIHTENPRTMNDYLKKITTARFVNDDSQFWVDLTTYRAAVEDVKNFMKWTVSELKKLQPRKSEPAIAGEE